MRLLLMLIGLAVVSTGLGGVLANTQHGEGLTGLLGLVISLTTLTLGLTVLITGLRATWSKC
jgi:hypothetical protein